MKTSSWFSLNGECQSASSKSASSKSASSKSASSKSASSSRRFRVLALGALALLTVACGAPRDDGKHGGNSKDANRYLGYNLIRDNCQGSFEYLSEPPGQEEVTPFATDPVDMQAIDHLLRGDGATGWIHAAVPAHNVWVWTFRQDQFFRNYQFPLAFRDESIRGRLASLNRHDKVTLKGRILDHDAAHKHILVTDLEVVKPFANGAYKPNYPRDDKLIRELAGQREAVVKVHSLDHGGESLVVEYKDMVVQVVVSDPQHTKSLFRNDKIRIHYEAQLDPDRPLHLNLRTDVAQPIEIIDPMVGAHKKEAIVQGCLVLFPQSPQINRNIFALLEIDERGLMRTWTLANFDVEIIDGKPSTPTFDAITAKLQKAWDRDEDSARNYRNKMANTGIRVRAKGTLNVVAANQANPQILLASADDLEVTGSGFE